MTWEVKEGKGSEPPVVLPKKNRRIGNVVVEYEFMEPGTAFIRTEGGTVDDRWLAFTVCREELAACGIRHAEFNFDQGDPIHPGTPPIEGFPEGAPPWKLGRYGKGIITPNGEIYHWSLKSRYGHQEDDPDGYPFHDHVMYGLDDLDMRDSSRFRINRDGTYMHYAWDQPHSAEEMDHYISQIPGVKHRVEYGNTGGGYIPPRGEEDSTDYDWTTSRVQKIAAWPDIMAKAKRLIQSGNVTLLRNGTNNVVGHVIGDHGEYQTEISRDDPNSRSITQWTCECPWDQYAFQRTRQWKKYEGRPCAHVLATYWKSLATPVDDQIQGPGPGTTPAGPAMPPGPGMPPGGGIATPQGWQQAPGSEGMVYTGPGGPGGMPMAPHPYGPQLTPALQPIPSFDQPPLGAPQFPGYPIPSGEPRIPHYRIPMEMTPPQIGLGNPMTQGLMDQMAGPLGTPLQQFAPPADNNILPPYPLAEQTLPPPQPVSTPGARPGPYPANPLQQPGTFSKTYHVAKAGDEFPPGSAARMEESTLGQTEGREGAIDAGEWREIPKNTLVEVIHQDPTTGWVEVMMPLKGGPMTSYHIRCFVEPEKLTPVGNRTPFENPKGRFT